jgi:hypothetical protein
VPETFGVDMDEPDNAERTMLWPSLADDPGESADVASTAGMDPHETATAQPRTLASEPNILELAVAEVAAAGVAGESRAIRLLYLIITSRLLERPCSIALKGPSAGGKSFLVGQTLELFPPSAYYALSAMSDWALAYDTEPLAHRMLVIYEAAGFQSDIASYLTRSLLSEGRVDYVTVDKGKSGLTSRRIIREGPTGLITTTTAVSLHPENETRLLSLTVVDTPEQTQAVMLAHARRTRADRDRAVWHEFQSWLAEQPTGVEIPYAETLAAAIPPVAVRLRRDFPTLLHLISANALLHQRSRLRTSEGAVIASLDDYAVVRELVWDLMADAAERSVSQTVRETVATVAVLCRDDVLGEGVTQTAVAAHLGIDKSTAQRRSKVAANRGFLRNLEHRRGHAARLVIGDQLPADGSLLPTASDLERLHGCSPDGNEPRGVDFDYPRTNFATGDDDPAAPQDLTATSALGPAGDRT